MRLIGKPPEYARGNRAGAALVVGKQQWDHSAFWQAVEADARGLVQAGLAGRAVALCQNDPGVLLRQCLAVARAGGRAMVLDPGWPPARFRELVDAISPAALFHNSLLPKSGGDDPALPDTGPEELFYVGFTSGSTGLPKGFARTHRSWLLGFRFIDDYLAATPAGTSVLIPGSLATSLHFFGAMHGLHTGLRVIVQSGFRPDRLAAQLRIKGELILYATPTQLLALVRYLEKTGASPCPTVRHILVSGARWQSQDRQRVVALFPRARLTEFYGTSETSFIALHDTDAPAPGGSVGRAVPGVEIRIGPTPECPQPPGQPGRIWVRSQQLFAGYECGGGTDALWHDGWLTVGDHGWLDTQGYLYLAGREKRMLVTKGHNLYPEQLESWLEQHPAVARAVIVGIPDRSRGQQLVAVLEAVGGVEAVSTVSLRQHCQEQFGHRFLPRHWLWRREWPLLPGGKLDMPAVERWVAGQLAQNL